MIEIIDDFEIEQEAESFFVTLERTDTLSDRIELILPSAEVAIHDNDSKLVTMLGMRSIVC